MKFIDDHTQQLPLLGGVVQQQRLVVPSIVIWRLATFRQACRLCWKLRNPRITQRTLAELADLYPPHVSDYFRREDNRRELPARKVALVERVLGNTVITQWLAHQGQLTVLEELQAHQVRQERRARAA